MKSGVEDIDQAKIIMSYQMEQVAMEASYNLAAQIGKMTILNFL
jgi:flagellin-like hook-associated protein FlgL